MFDIRDHGGIFGGRRKLPFPIVNAEIEAGASIKVGEAVTFYEGKATNDLRYRDGEITGTDYSVQIPEKSPIAHLSDGRFVYMSTYSPHSGSTEKEVRLHLATVSNYKPLLSGVSQVVKKVDTLPYLREMFALPNSRFLLFHNTIGTGANLSVTLYSVSGNTFSEIANYVIDSVSLENFRIVKITDNKCILYYDQFARVVEVAGNTVNIGSRLAVDTDMLRPDVSVLSQNTAIAVYEYKKNSLACKVLKINGLTLTAGTRHIIHTTTSTTIEGYGTRISDTKAAVYFIDLKDVSNLTDNTAYIQFLSVSGTNIVTGAKNAFSEEVSKGSNRYLIVKALSESTLCIGGANSALVYFKGENIEKTIKILPPLVANTNEVSEFIQLTPNKFLYEYYGGSTGTNPRYYLNTVMFPAKAQGMAIENGNGGQIKKFYKWSELN